MTKINIFVLIAIVVIISVVFVLFAKKTSNETLPQSVLGSFARCLASKNLTMYGAEWCSHCQKEKSLFGEAFKYVPYVECPENEKLCLEKGVRGYPTWIDNEDTKYEGEQGLEKLSEMTSCPLVE